MGGPGSGRRARGYYARDPREAVKPAEPEDEAVAEYKKAAMDAYRRALLGGNVARDVTFLRQAEQALAAHGIVAFTGDPWNMSTLVELAQR